MSRGPRDLVESTAVNIKFLFAYVMGMVFFRHPDTRHTKKHVIVRRRSAAEIENAVTCE